MSEDAIADVGTTLIEILRNGLFPRQEQEQQRTTITLGSPVGAEERGVRLTLFLYSIIETPELKNAPNLRVSEERESPPPLTLDLHYMLTGYSAQPMDGDRTAETVQAHRILGAAMQVLRAKGVIKGPDLRGSLRGSGQELRLTLNPISNEDLTRIWSVFPDMSYRASVTYLVTPVRIAPLSEEDTVRRVLDAEAQGDQIEPNREDRQ